MASAAIEFKDKLLNYESSTLVRRRYKEFHGGSLNDAKAKEISSAFAQARNYMTAASISDRTVRPLLVYYGVLGYSRALILFRNIYTKESKLDGSHGLSVCEWGDELNKEGGSVANLKLVIAKTGTFVELLQATENVSFLRQNSSRPNLRLPLNAPKAGGIIKFGELALRIPELDEYTKRWLSQCLSIRLTVEKEKENKKILRTSSSMSEMEIKEVLGRGWEPHASKGTGLWQSDSWQFSAMLTDCTGSFDVGDLVAVPPFSNDIEISKLGCVFIGAYALGMLARYFPSRWSDMLYNRRLDECLPTIFGLLNHIENELPRFIIEFLEPPVP